MEKFTQHTEGEQEIKSKKGLLSSLKQTAGLVATIGLGYFGGSENVQGADATNLNSGQQSVPKMTDSTHIVTSVNAEAQKSQDTKDAFWLQKWLELEPNDAKVTKHIKEVCDEKGKHLLVEDVQMKLYGIEGDPTKYMARDERYGESFYITAINNTAAEAQARHYFYKNPQMKQAVKDFNKNERKLYEQGILKDEPPR